MKNIRIWWFTLTGQRRRAGGIKAARTRARFAQKPPITERQPAPPANPPEAA